MSDTPHPSEDGDTLRITPSATALTIAGSDPSGGAGLQADLKTFQQLGVYGMSVVTLLTVQNTQAVTRVHVLPNDLILEQLLAVLSDIPPRAIKIGAIGNPDVVHTISEVLGDVSCPIVVDPVLVSKHGHLLADDDVVHAYRTKLLSHAFLVTLIVLRRNALPDFNLRMKRAFARRSFEFSNSELGLFSSNSVLSTVCHSTCWVWARPITASKHQPFVATTPMVPVVSLPLPSPPNWLWVKRTFLRPLILASIEPMKPCI